MKRHDHPEAMTTTLHFERKNVDLGGVVAILVIIIVTIVRSIVPRRRPAPMTLDTLAVSGRLG